MIFDPRFVGNDQQKMEPYFRKKICLDFKRILFHKYYLKHQQLFKKYELAITNGSAYKKLTYKPGFQTLKFWQYYFQELLKFYTF